MTSTLFLLIRQERVHEFLLTEDLQVVYALTQANVLHRYLELIGYADHHTSLSCPVELGHGEGIHFSRCGELPCLFESILTGGSVQYQ